MKTAHTHSKFYTPKSIIILFFTSVCSIIVFSLLLSSQTHSLTGSQFNPGRIIDDSVFNNQDSMTPSQIQLFLDDRMPSCDTNGDVMYNSTQTRAQWASANGRPLPPYTCLNEYTQNITGVINGGSDLCTGSISSGTKSSAQIIYDVAQTCGINPQVLLVMLQKEQSLLTDTWPWPTQYDKAMGYACPDSGPNFSANCNAEYFGFFNQVYNAAKAFRRYEANPNSYNYKAQRNNTILYNPNPSCGSSTVFIENQATANLYIYTPYQPNQAALDNLYGTGDGCSAYGNRNFWRMFNDWFGDPTTKTGNIEKVKTYITWRGDWDKFVSLDIAGNGDDEVLFYQQNGSEDGSARGEFYDVSDDGKMPRIKTYTTWRNWDNIEPIDIDGDGNDELLFFKKGAGTKDGRLEIYDVLSDGRMPRIKTYTGWTNWDILTPLDIDGNGDDELLVYMNGSGSGDGLGIFYDVLSDGRMPRLKTHTTWSEWDKIIGIDVGGNKTDEILFYRGGETTARAEFYGVNMSGIISQDNVHTDWPGDLDLIEPVDIQGSTGPELFMYTKQSGIGEFYNLIPGSEVVLLRRHQLRTSIDIASAINFQPDNGSEILLYNQRTIPGRGEYFNIER